MKTKIVEINGQKWEITKPDNIGDEMALREIAGCHISVWALMHTKYIGKRLSDGEEYWLPWNYKQFIIEYIKQDNLTDESLIVDNLTHIYNLSYK